MAVVAVPADAYSRRRWSGAIILWNYTDIAIPYRVTADGRESCCPGSSTCEGVLQPGEWQYHGRTREPHFAPFHFEKRSERSIHFAVRFDGHLAPGVQATVVHLPHNTVEGDRTQPMDGRAYAFMRVAREIWLVKGDHPLVAGIGRPKFADWAKTWAPPPPPTYREWLWKPTGTVSGTPGATLDPDLGKPTLPRAGYPGYPGMGTQVPTTLSPDAGAGPSSPSGAYLRPGSSTPPATTGTAGAGPSTIGRPTGNPGYQPMSGAASGVTPGTSSPPGTRPAIPNTTPNP